MDYKQAKELEEAGFPQGGKGTWVLPPDRLVARSGDRVYVPTLEELIEACGDAFEALTQEHSRDHNEWVASECDVSGRQAVRHGRGATPSEAVGKLWLTLNRKEG